MGTLSTGGVSGALLGPLAGGLLADHYGLRPVFFITASVLFLCFPGDAYLYPGEFHAGSQKRDAARPGCAGLAEKPKAGAESVCDYHDYPVATGSIAPILTLYVRDLAGNVSNIAFISGLIASVPGVAALLSAPRLGKLGDRIGPEKILICALIVSVLLLIPMAMVQSPPAARRPALPAGGCRWRTAPGRADAAGL